MAGPRCGAETSHSFEHKLDQTCELPFGHECLRHKWTHPSGSHVITWVDMGRLDAAIADSLLADSEAP